MTDLVAIGAGAVQVYQRALGTVSNNVANMATEGYSRQETVIIDNGPKEVGGLYYGTGARVQTIQRLYDSFIENSLRSSISDVKTQGPLVDYIDRVVDIMGSQTTGMASAMDTFFTSVRALSTDAASIELRGQLISGADGLASRFRFLNGQLDTLEDETAEAVRVKVSSINTLAEELATVNRQLDRRSRTSQQAPALLDHRDQLLRDLAELVRIRVVESPNGTVKIGLGASDNEGMIVTEDGFRLIEANFDPQTLRVKLVADPTGLRETVSDVNGGELGGFLNFREQVLAPAVQQLDALAQTINNYFNATHEVGMDANGRLGGDLFTIDPVYKLLSPTTKEPIPVQWEVVDPAETRFNDIELSFEPETALWTATDTETGESAQGIETMTLNGVRIRIDARPLQREVLTMAASNRPSAGIRVLIDDPKAIAAASPVRILESPENNSGADASIAWQPDQRDSLPLRSVATFPPSSDWQKNGVTISNSSGKPVTLAGKLDQGMSQVALTLEAQIELPMDIQVFTRDGRHIAGRALSDADQVALIDSANGFIPGSTYSTQYLNKSSDLGYRDLSVFYGAFADPREMEIRDSSGKVVGSAPVAAELVTRSIPNQLFEPGAPLITAGALTLNGMVLGEFAPVAPTGALEASEIAGWLSSEVDRLGLNSELSVSATNVVRVPADVIRFDRQLTINGVAILPVASGPSSVPELANRINQLMSVAQSTNTPPGQARVLAFAGESGELVLTNIDGEEGRDIVIGPPNSEFTGALRGALGIYAGRHAGQVKIEALDTATSVELGLGLEGTSSDLARLGFSTQVRIDGSLPEDLIVMTTGEGRASLAAEFLENPVAPLADLRSRTFEIVFTSESRWKLIDTASETVLAERDYDPLAGIHYRGLQVSLSRPPEEGDRFVIDGNSDGVGDNSNILKLAGLEKSRDMIYGGRTLLESWLDKLNAIGNLGNQAKIAQEALEIVNQQAVEARDRVSGVSLDEEASDLIRFQQAYQASAKIMQMANQVFDAILGIR